MRDGTMSGRSILMGALELLLTLMGDSLGSQGLPESEVESEVDPAQP